MNYKDAAKQSNNGMAFTDALGWGCVYDLDKDTFHDMRRDDYFVPIDDKRTLAILKHLVEKWEPEDKAA